MKVDKNRAVILMLIILVLLMYQKSCSNKIDLSQQISLYEAVADSLKRSKDKLGRQITRTSLLRAQTKKDFLKIKSQDSTILKLQGVVDDYKGKLESASIVVVATNSSGSTETIVEVHDTVKEDSVVFIYPIYSTKWHEKWSKGEIRASKDSIYREVVMFNQYEITQGYEKQGFLKGKKPTVMIKNLNPNTQTIDVKSFLIEPEKKKFSVGVGAMYGVNALTFQPTVVLGVGVQYKLFNF